MGSASLPTSFSVYKNRLVFFHMLSFRLIRTEYLLFHMHAFQFTGKQSFIQLHAIRLSRIESSFIKLHTFRFTRNEPSFLHLHAFRLTKTNQDFSINKHNFRFSCLISKSCKYFCTQGSISIKNEIFHQFGLSLNVKFLRMLVHLFTKNELNTTFDNLK